MKTLVISPTYNERKNIQFLIEQALDPNPDYHLLVVDDVNINELVTVESPNDDSDFSIIDLIFF